MDNLIPYAIPYGASYQKQENQYNHTYAQIGKISQPPSGNASIDGSFDRCHNQDKNRTYYRDYQIAHNHSYFGTKSIGKYMSKDSTDQQ